MYLWFAGIIAMNNTVKHSEHPEYCTCTGCWQTVRCKVQGLQAEVARLTSEVKEWLCDTCNTVYPGPPQKGVWCVVCPSCGGNTAPTKTIELRKANARISELEAAIRGWYEWRFNDDPSDRPLDRINDIAKRLLDGRGE